MFKALIKQIISAFDAMYLDMLNDYMIGFVNTMPWEIIEYVISTSENIAPMDIDRNFE
jgi:hypothetical protein